MAATMMSGVNGDLKVSWVDADWMLKVLGDLGVDTEAASEEGGVWTFGPDAGETLKKAFNEGRIGGVITEEDPMGRTLTDPEVFPLVGGKEPLPDHYADMIKRLIQVLTP